MQFYLVFFKKKDKKSKEFINIKIKNLIEWNPYLKSEIGSAYIRVDNSKFEIDAGSKSIIIRKQNR